MASFSPGLDVWHGQRPTRRSWPWSRTTTSRRTNISLTGELSRWNYNFHIWSLFLLQTSAVVQLHPQLLSDREAPHQRGDVCPRLPGRPLVLGHRRHHPGDLLQGEVREAVGHRQPGDGGRVLRDAGGRPGDVLPQLDWKVVTWLLGLAVTSISDFRGWSGTWWSTRSPPALPTSSPTSRWCSSSSPR